MNPISTEAMQPAAPTKYERILYGLPCAHCGTYYAADVESCPICHSSDRVPAVARLGLR
jgi:uncharacterized OB-fold protein